MKITYLAALLLIGCGSTNVTNVYEEADAGSDSATEPDSEVADSASPLPDAAPSDDSSVDGATADSALDAGAHDAAPQDAQALDSAAPVDAAPTTVFNGCKIIVCADLPGCTEGTILGCNVTWQVGWTASDGTRGQCQDTEQTGPNGNMIVSVPTGPSCVTGDPCAVLYMNPQAFGNCI